MLSIWRRHQSACPHKTKGRKFRKCSCPLWVTGYLGQIYIRESLDTRSWEKAQFIVRDIEAKSLLPAPEPKADPVTIADAIKRFHDDAVARNISEATRYKYAMLLDRQLVEFAKGKGLLNIDQFNLETVAEFRNSWKDSAISALKKLERLRAFFRFCHDRGYISENPVAKLKPPKITASPTLPFTDEELEKILSACDLFSTHGRYRAQNRTRVRAMVLLLRHSGLRIGDAVTLTRDKIRDGKLLLHTAKTGVPVWLPLKEEVLDELGKLDTHPRFYFWNGEGKLTSAVGVWERTFKRLFEIAGIEGGHAHRFRDTFAVGLLEKGVPIEGVAKLLGHSDVRVTQKHYSPHVRSSQVILEEYVRRTWG